MNSTLSISVVTKNLTNPAYVGARIGIDRTLIKYGIKAKHYAPKTPDDISEQSELVQRAIDDRPNAILLTPAHSTLMSEVIENVIGSRIPLFCFVSEPKPSPAITFVGSDDYALGVLMANYLASNINGEGDIVIVNGHPNADTAGPRREGFWQGLSQYPEVVIRDEFSGYYQRGLAAKGFENIIRGKEPPDGILAANDFMACGIRDVLRKREIETAIVGANATPDGIALIKEGAMLASAAFDAMSMASLAAESAIRYLQGKEVPRMIKLPVEMVDRDNVSHWDKSYTERGICSWEQAMGLKR